LKWTAQSGPKRAQFTRRSFLGAVSLAGTGCSLWGLTAAAARANPSYAPTSVVPIYFFTKPLDGFETEFIADTIAEAGFDGVDVTVRPGGKILPERVEIQLPKFAEVIRGRNLNVKMMVTSITGTESPHAEQILSTASQVGIQYYRLGYLDYDFRAGITSSLKRHNAALIELAKLNQKYSVQAGYHNHTGTSVGAAVWDLGELLREIPVGQVSVQYDIRHAVAESADSWVVGLRLLRPHIRSLVVKDFKWDISSRRSRITNVPLGNGIVDFDTYFQLVKELGIHAPISLHAEYPLLSPMQEGLSLLEKQRIIAAKLRADFAYLRSQLATHHITDR
jgi:sugar phosphate isomerase/epimerase